MIDYEKKNALKKTITFVIAFLLGFLACIGGVIYFLFTEKGSQIIVDQFINHTIKDKNVSFAKLQGNFITGFKLEDLEIRNIASFPEGSSIRIQELVLNDSVWDLQKSHFFIRNGRIILKDSDPVVFEGNYREGALDFSVYTKSLDVAQLKEIFKPPQVDHSVTGNIESVDFKISGTWSEPKVTGSFYIEELDYQDFTLVESPAVLDLKFKNQPDKIIPSGTLVLEGGRLLAKNTEVNVQKSTFYITNDFTNPDFSIHADAKIEDTAINILLTGTKNKPEIKLTSDSGFSSDRLLLMVVTGKSWKGLDASFDQKQISPDLVKDFIDYFMFSGSGEKLADKFGIKNTFLILQKDKRGIGAKKRVTNNLDVGYEVLQSQITADKKSTQQKISADVKVSDNVSLGAEKEIRTKNQPSQSLQDNPQDDKVLLKYKTKF